MSLTSRLFASICLSSVILSGCTVDAQLASKLLSSLQNSVNEAGADDNAVTLEDGSVVSAIADAGKNYQVVCGGDMSIASLEEEATDSTESTEATDATETTETTATTETVLEEAEVVEPIVVAPVEATATAPAKRVRLSADLQGKLRQLSKYQGADRQRQFQDIQRNYPEMRNTQAVPVRSATGVQQAIFIYIGGQQAAAPTTQARPAVPANAAGHPFMTQPQAGTRPGFGGQYGGQFGGHYGNSTAGKPGQATTRPVKATPTTSAKPTTSTGTTRVGFAGSVEIGGQTCRVVARESTTTDSTDTTSTTDSSDDSAAE